MKVKVEKKIKVKQIDSSYNIEDVNNRKSEQINSHNTLLRLGIETIDEDENNRPFNEVFADLGKLLKMLRETEDKTSFEIKRQYILRAICGIRYMHQFMC